MNARQIAQLSRSLIAACGGLEEAAGACRVSKTQLQRCQDPAQGAFLAIDVVAALESYCGQPIISKALADAAPAAAAARCLLAEACEAAEATSGVQRTIRLAAVDGEITPREREEIRRGVLEAKAQLRDVEEALDQEALP